VDGRNVEGQFVTLVVGLFCVGALATVAVIAASNSWLTAAAGVGFLGLTVGAARGGVPRALVWVTATFGVAMCALAAFTLLA
jgi:hypothetical protein